MENSARTHRNAVTKALSLLVLLAAVANLSAQTTSCQPFPASDPPPGFAVRYTYAGPYYEVTQVALQLKAKYLVDAVPTNPAFTVTGHTGNALNEFGPQGMGSGQYWSVKYQNFGARWPARYTFTSVFGACVGTQATFNVQSKIVPLLCTPQVGVGSVSVTPGAYPGGSPPPSIMLDADVSTVPASTDADVMVINLDAAIVESIDDVTFDGAGDASTVAPSLYDGDYAVFIAFDSHPNGVESIVADLSIYGNGGYNPPFGGGPVALGPGASLGPGEFVTSPSWAHRFVYQETDGNLVLYQLGTWIPLWAAKCWGASPCDDWGPPQFATMQLDGNLVVYNGSGIPVWQSGTGGNPGAYLSLDWDGNLVIYAPNGTPLWWP